MYFRFELFNLEKENYNISDCFYVNRENIGNFMLEDNSNLRLSQMLDSFLYYYQTSLDQNDTILFEHIDSKNEVPYIIPLAVHYNPYDWTDMDISGIVKEGKKSIFELMNPKFLSDLQQGKALFLIDQSVEGYSTDWLWKWFHDKCEYYKISPSLIVYGTGDQSCVDKYKVWCDLHNPSVKLKVIPSISLSMYIRMFCEKWNINPNFDQLLEHKNKNQSNLFLYDCTNMRPRPQRILNFLHLLNSDLLSEGNISMPSQKEWHPFINMNYDEYFIKYGLPKNIVSKLTPEMTPRIAKYNYNGPTVHYYTYVERVLDDMYKNSWVSLVTESSYFEHEHSVFISEKTFKPIACLQPFIIVGSKGVLKYLRKLGYKTFHPFIDESYDDAPDGERFTAIINSLQKIKQIENKTEWYNSMRSILEHNYNLFREIGYKKSLEHTEFSNYYYNYFKKNV